MVDSPEPLSTPTANYGWAKPTVGADLDAWGGEINTTLDGIDATVFGIQGSVPAASSANPAMDGTAAPGVATAFARGDHVHPVDTSRYAASNPAGYQTAAQVTAALPAASTATPVMDGTAAAGSSAAYARGDHVHPTDSSRYAASNPSGFQTAAQVAAAVPAASTANPKMDGTAAPGINTPYAREDHVHPTDTSLYPASNPSGFQTAAQVTASLGGYLPLTGGVLTGALTPSQTLGLVGTNTNNNANAGAVGEFVTASRTTNLSIANGAQANVTSISLTAGDWDVEGNVTYTFSTNAGTVATNAISTLSATLPSTSPYTGQFYLGLGTANLGLVIGPTGRTRLSLSATTTVYLVAAASFSSGTCQTQGTIIARRVR